MPGKCSFNDNWLQHDDSKNWKLWLRPIESNKFKARCILCKCDFDVRASGISCVKTHERGKRHLELVHSLVSGQQSKLPFAVLKAVPVQSQVSSEKNLNTGNELPSLAPATTSRTSVEESSKTNSLKHFLVTDEVIKSEIIWAMNKVMSHSSVRSSGNTTDIFQIMFPDSMIAKKMQLHKDKMSYIITYGLGPHFQNLLANKVREVGFFCVSYDESLNKVVQKGQMDLVVRFWDEENQSVSTRYLTSVFLNSATSSDLQSSFLEGVKGLNLSPKNIIQISMDGPNVNLKMLHDLQAFLINEEDNQPQMFYCGTCSLHVVNGALKTAHNKSGWNVYEFLRVIWYFMKDFPSRRATFSNITGFSKFPLKFCSIRWVGNIEVMKRALELIPHLKKYVSEVHKKPPETRNFEKIKCHLEDKFLCAKLEFLISLSIELEEFLTKYQSNDSLFPFLYKDLLSLMHSIASRFIKKTVMEMVTNSSKLLAIDVTKACNHKKSHYVDIGFGATAASKNYTEKDILIFRNECTGILQSLYLKIAEKSPLKLKIVKGGSCLSPEVMQSSILRNSRVTIALEEFVSKKHMTPSTADIVKREYFKFCEYSEKQLKQFNPKKDKLDHFLMNLLQSANHDFIKFVQKLLCMFHGNAAVERGFSVNKEVLVENLEEDTVVAERSVYNAIQSLGGLLNSEKQLNVDITKSMILAVKNASSKRVQALKKKKSDENEVANLKRKTVQEIKELKDKKRMIIEQAKEEAEVLDVEISSLAKKLKH